MLDDEALHAEIMEMRPDGIEVVQVGIEFWSDENAK